MDKRTVLDLCAHMFHPKDVEKLCLPLHEESFMQGLERVIFLLELLNLLRLVNVRTEVLSLSKKAGKGISLLNSSNY